MSYKLWLLGQLACIGAGFLIGYEYSWQAGAVTFYVTALFVDIRYDLDKLNDK